MRELLTKFWRWHQITPEKYAQKGMNQNIGEFEDAFPEFDVLLKTAFSIVDYNINESADIYDLLTVLAIDNEAETVLEYIEENSSDEQLKTIVEIGIYHLQPQARWQVAELVYRRRPNGYLEYLSVLSNDHDSYVRTRTKNIIEALKSQA